MVAIIQKEESGMWTIKLMTVRKYKGKENLYCNNYLNCKSLKKAYRVASELCRKQNIAVAALYQNQDLDTVLADDVTKRTTMAKYQLLKGCLGAIYLLRKEPVRTCAIRENRKDD